MTVRIASGGREMLAQARARVMRAHFSLVVGLGVLASRAQFRDCLGLVRPAKIVSTSAEGKYQGIEEF